MRLERLQLENFRSHTELDLPLGQIECAAIVGRNGAGKSSILTAIDYAFYGGPSDQLVRQGTDKMGVMVELYADEQYWRVSRGRELDKRSWLVIEHRADAKNTKWETVPTHTVKEGQALIERAITGMDADAYAASVYAPQGRAGLLAGMGPGDRKALLGNLLGLDRYEEWRGEAAARARICRDRAEHLAKRIEEDTGTIEQLAKQAELEPKIAAEVEQRQQRLGELEGEHDAAIEREKVAVQVAQRADLVRQMERLINRRRQAEMREEERQKVQGRVLETQNAPWELKGMEEKKASHDAAVAVVEAGKREKAAADADLHRVSERESELRREATRLERQLEETRAEGAKCFTCGQALPAGEAQAAAVHSLEKSITQAQSELEACGPERKEANERRMEALKRAEGGSENGFDPEAYAKLRELATEHERLKGQLEGLAPTESVDDLRAEWQELKDKAEALPESAPEGPAPATVREQIAEARSAMESARGELEEIQRDVLRGENLRDGLEAAEDELADSRRDASALEIAAKAFSRQGVPAMVLDNAVGGIEEAANGALRDLGVSLTIRLATQRQSKRGGLVETLDILVDDGTFERPLEGFSGGEQYRVHVALRLGLASMLEAGSGREMDLLLIDEPTDLDGAGVTMLADLLTKTGRQVLLVSHDESYIDAMPQRITVERSNDAAASTVTLA